MSEHTPIPVGPADITYTRRALARLALSAAAREVADFAAGMVPTVSDEYGNAYEDVETATARNRAHAVRRGFEEGYLQPTGNTHKIYEDNHAEPLTGETAP
jgi:hypothetical protein